MVRVREHLSGNSAIFERICSCNACNHSTMGNFHILSHGHNDFDNKVKDTLCIKKQKPLLNKHLFNQFTGFVIIDVIIAQMRI